MKPKIIIFSILLLSITFMSSSCEKESPEDPRFSCKINGELWNPKDGNFSFGLTANYDYQPDIGRDVFDILAAQHNHPRYLEVAVTFIKPNLGLQKAKNSHLRIRDFKVNGYFLDTLLPNKIILKTFDKINRTATGTFEGYLYNIDYNDSLRIHVTDGKFNVKF